MQLWLQATVLLLTSASAAIITSSAPANLGIESEEVDHNVADSVASDVSIQIPTIHCTGCFTNELGVLDRDIDIAVTLRPSDRECDPTRLMLNGTPLQLSHEVPVTSGSLIIGESFTSAVGGGTQVRWSLQCDDVEASLLTVSLPDAARPTGFAFSFSQRRQVPLSLPGRRESIDLDLSSYQEPATTIENPSTTLETEFHKLEGLKKELARLHDDYSQQEHVIYELLLSELKQCTGFSCYLRTALHKSTDIYELAKSHIGFGHMRPHFAKTPAQRPVHQDSTVDSETVTSSDNDVAAQSTPTQPTSRYTLFAVPSTDQNEPHSRPDRVSDSNPSVHSGFHIQDYSASLPTRSYLFALGCVLSTLMIVSCLFLIVKTGIRYYRDPERQRDLAAQREERRTRAAYRRAACRYRFTQSFTKIWSIFRWRLPATADYEEKRATILAARDMENDNVMSTQFAALRRTYSLVNQMVRAEEGRAGSDDKHDSGRATSLFRTRNQSSNNASSNAEAALPLYQPLATTFDPRERAASGSVRSLPPYEPPSPRSPYAYINANSHRQQQFHIFPQPFEDITRPAQIFRRTRRSSNGSARSLPSYQQHPPPSYGADLEGEISIIEGFQFSRSNTDITQDDSASAPDSSVVDCDSEMSFDTRSNRS